jgi:hypothetical protein
MKTLNSINGRRIRKPCVSLRESPKKARIQAVKRFILRNLIKKLQPAKG